MPRPVLFPAAEDREVSAPPAPTSMPPARRADLVLRPLGEKGRHVVKNPGTGEYYRIHRRSFDPRQRVDRNLLRDLKAARERLGSVDSPRETARACRLG